MDIISDGSDKYFNDEWNLWYHHILDNWTINGYKNIYTIKTIKDFWDFNNYINNIGGINIMNFFIMRKNITLIWEDTHNKFGGSWSVLIPVNDTIDICTRISAHVLSETFIEKYPNLITGISISQKNNVSILKIWNNDKSIKDISLLPEYLTKYGNVIYRAHKVMY